MDPASQALRATVSPPCAKPHEYEFEKYHATPPQKKIVQLGEVKHKKYLTCSCSCSGWKNHFFSDIISVQKLFTHC
jgi:predicted nucleic-acid-binding Zn-ribbon protein